jgi:hypothetical protein
MEFVWTAHRPNGQKNLTKLLSKSSPIKKRLEPQNRPSMCGLLQVADAPPFFGGGAFLISAY